jgi:hypothetical protein
VFHHDLCLIAAYRSLLYTCCKMTVSKAKVSADAMGIASTTRDRKKTTLKTLLAWWRRRYFMRVPAAIVLFAHQQVRPVLQ